MRAQAKTVRSLRLIRSLASFDLETTGTAVQINRIVEIGIVKLDSDGAISKFHKRINPGVRIPREATRVHGITNEDVAEAPTFREVAKEIYRLLKRCDFVGFNVATFDFPLLLNEFDRAEVKVDFRDIHLVDVKEIFHLKEPRDLSAAVHFYCDRDHMGAHSAVVDAEATVDVLHAQVNRYRDLPLEISLLAAVASENRKKRFLDSGGWFESRDGKHCFAKGKYRGEKLSNVAKSACDYLHWVLTLEDLPKDTRQMIKKCLGDL